MTWFPGMGGDRWPGGFQPGGITGGPGQGWQMPTLPNGQAPTTGAANGGLPPPGTGTAPLPGNGWHLGRMGQGPIGQGLHQGMGHFGQGLHSIYDGLRNARTDFRDGLISRLGQLPSMLGMQPRPGGTAGGGWSMPQGFQMPQGFAARLPFGHPGPGGGPGAMGGGVGHREPDREPDADSDDTPGGYGMNNRFAADSINRMAARNNAASGGGQPSKYTPKDPAARAAMNKKAEEIGKKARGY